MITSGSPALRQVDVFTAVPYLGNPVAVVHDAVDVTPEAMSIFPRWTNLSECAFLLPPTTHGAAAGADYRVRIFSPGYEMSFAGHPTVGACHAWLEAGGVPHRDDRIVQECGVGLVHIRRDGDLLAFAAPPLAAESPIEPELLKDMIAALGIPAEAVVDHRMLDNGAVWHVLLLDSGDRVRGLNPDFSTLSRAYPDLAVGVVGPDSGETAIEVRGFALGMGIPEDPVTGSLNASVAQWLIGTGRLPDKYVAAQGTAMGRAGRVHVTAEEDDIWIGGEAVTCIEGTVRL